MNQDPKSTKANLDRGGRSDLLVQLPSSSLIRHVCSPRKVLCVFHSRIRAPADIGLVQFSLLRRETWHTRTFQHVGLFDGVRPVKGDFFVSRCLQMAPAPWFRSRAPREVHACRRLYFKKKNGARGGRPQLLWLECYLV